MSKWSKVLRGIGLLAVAAVLGTLIGWLASRQGDVAPVAVPPASAPAANPSLAIAPAAAQTPDPRSVPIIIHEPVREEPGVGADQGFPDWEQKLDDILLAEEEPNTKADRILALIPTAPPDAQVELSQHLVNMVQDDHYAGAAQLLTNAVTPSAVSTVLMNDLLNRANTIKLPMLLAVAQNSDHPLKDQAREMLELLLQQDNGTNWDQWSSSIDTWLQNNQQ